MTGVQQVMESFGLKIATGARLCN